MSKFKPKIKYLSLSINGIEASLSSKEIKILKRTLSNFLSNHTGLPKHLSLFVKNNCTINITSSYSE